MKSRRERRQEAKEKKVKFEPQYSSGKRFVNGEVIIVGGEPKTYEEAYGIGYERFNDKFVTIKEVENKEE